MIRPSRLLLLDILLLQAFISVKISLRSILWPVCGACACTVGLFEYLSTLMLICAQSGRVSGLVKKTDPASSSRSDKRGLKENNNRMLGIVKNVLSLLVQKVRYYSVGGSTVTAL